MLHSFLSHMIFTLNQIKVPIHKHQLPCLSPFRTRSSPSRLLLATRGRFGWSGSSLSCTSFRCTVLGRIPTKSSRFVYKTPSLQSWGFFTLQTSQLARFAAFGLWDRKVSITLSNFCTLKFYPNHKTSLHKSQRVAKLQRRYHSSFSSASRSSKHSAHTHYDLRTHSKFKPKSSTPVLAAAINSSHLSFLSYSCSETQQ